VEAANIVIEAMAKVSNEGQGRGTQETGGIAFQEQSQVDDEQILREGLPEDGPFAQDEDTGGMGELSLRQANILCHISEHGSMNIQDVENLYPDVNRRTLQRDLKVMVDKGLIISEGATHQTTYRSK